MSFVFPFALFSCKKDGQEDFQVDVFAGCLEFAGDLPLQLSGTGPSMGGPLGQVSATGELVLLLSRRNWP